MEDQKVVKLQETLSDLIKDLANKSPILGAAVFSIEGLPFVSRFHGGVEEASIAAIVAAIGNGVKFIPNGRAASAKRSDLDHRPVQAHPAHVGCPGQLKHRLGRQLGSQGVDDAQLLGDYPAQAGYQLLYALS